MNEDLTRSTIFAPNDGEVPPYSRRSLSRFVMDRLANSGVSASVESLRSTTRAFLLVSVSAEIDHASDAMADHGNALGEWLLHEIHANFQEEQKIEGIFWRILPPANASQPLGLVFKKARAELEAKIRKRRAQRADPSSPDPQERVFRVPPEAGPLWRTACGAQKDMARGLLRRWS